MLTCIIIRKFVSFHISLLMIPQSVPCMITGVNHLPVTQNLNQNAFNASAMDILTRLNNGEEVRVAIDCEGFQLGYHSHSLGILQIAECFKSGFPSSNSSHVSIEFQQGFLIKTPFSQQTTTYLSNILSHKNIKIIMFGCTCDIPAILEEGVNLNIKAIIDGQTYSIDRPKSLKDTIGIATNCVEYNNALRSLATKDEINFDLFYYQNKDKPDPFSIMLTQRFWNYSGNDIGLTAIGLMGALRMTSFENLIRSSNIKTQKIYDLIQRHGYIAPACENGFQYSPPYINGRIPNMEVALKLYVRCCLIEENFNLYQLFAPWDKKLSLNQIRQGKSKALNYIRNQRFY